MTQLKSRITSNNSGAIYRYFSKALNDKQIFPIEDDPTHHYVITRAFNPLMAHRGSKKDSVFINQLQAWVDTYIDQTLWELCLKTIRDKNEHKKNQLYTLNLSYKAYQVISKYAKKAGLSIEHAIEQAARAELARLSSKTPLESTLSNTSE
jgi:hypothetical protein